MKFKYPLLVAALSIVSLALWWVLFVWQTPSMHDQRPQGGGFSLQSADGPVALSDFSGKIVILYFGYTRCPDICPTSMAFLSQALSRLNKEELHQVQPIFITLDPERDDLPYLKSYTQYFNERFIGLSGTNAQISEVSTRYGVAFRKVESNSAMGYMVDHSANIYIIDRSGHLSSQVAHGTPPHAIFMALKKLIHQNK